MINMIKINMKIKIRPFVCQDISLIWSNNLLKNILEMEVSLNVIFVAKLENLLMGHIAVHNVNMMCMKNA